MEISILDDDFIAKEKLIFDSGELSWQWILFNDI